MSALGANMRESDEIITGKMNYASKDDMYKTVMDVAPLARLAWATKDYTVEQKTACAPTMLLYARGTMEPGDNGVTLGPPLVKAGKSLGWGIRSITYADGYYASVADDFCVALPGGEACYKVLRELSKSCPTSNFLLAGYSQGAMVARICAAYQTQEVRQRVKVRKKA
jgi:hypothetical protein